MTLLQTLLVGTLAVFSAAVSSKGWYETTYKRNAFGLTSWLSLLGMFVWGDAALLGLFWVGITLATLFLDNWYFFLFSTSLFWSVRSLGEVQYWFNQQFSTLRRDPPETLTFYSLFNSEAIWFAYQVGWQCILVVSLLSALYTGYHWMVSII